jgi:hypothetical protein
MNSVSWKKVTGWSLTGFIGFLIWSLGASIEMIRSDSTSVAAGEPKLRTPDGLCDGSSVQESVQLALSLDGKPRAQLLAEPECLFEGRLT